MFSLYIKDKLKFFSQNSNSLSLKHDTYVTTENSKLLVKTSLQIHNFMSMFEISHCVLDKYM